MPHFLRFAPVVGAILTVVLLSSTVQAQLPVKYPTLELFTNTPCPICGSQNPGLFSRLAAYEGQYHLVSFYPGKPYSSCIFYQANISENTARLNFYTQVFGTPTVAINGTQFKSSSGVTTSVLDNVTGGESWLSVDVDETTGGLRTVNIALQDHVGGSATSATLFAVIVERLITYNAPNGETQHHNVFRKFLTNVNGDNVDMTSGTVTKTYQYNLDAAWQPDETYVVAWLMNPSTKEIYNSGTKFDPDITSGIANTSGNLPLEIYPNPASNFITLTLPQPVQDAKVKVYNLAGQVVLCETVTADKQVMLSMVRKPGSYIVELVADHKAWTGRVHIESQ